MESNVLVGKLSNMTVKYVKINLLEAGSLGGNIYLSSNYSSHHTLRYGNIYGPAMINIRIN